MPSPSDPDAHYALDIIKANARLLYGRAHTYDIVIAQPPLPTQNSSLGTPKFHGVKIHALLVAYDIESQERQGKLLRGAFSMGVLKTPPKVGEAIQILHEELAKEVEGLFRGLIEQPNFEGALIERRSLRGLGVVEASGKGKGKEGGDDADDGMDGITLRGD